LYGFARKRAPSGSSSFTLGGSAPDVTTMPMCGHLSRTRRASAIAVHVGHRDVREQRRDIIAKLNHCDGFDAVPSFEDEIPGILKDVRGGPPHNHLILNDEDDDRLARVRRLQGRSPGFPGETPIPSPILLLI
jgi:hypothetical protein